PSTTPALRPRWAPAASAVPSLFSDLVSMQPWSPAWSPAWLQPRSRWQPFVGLKTADFDYDLPRELIAQHPPAERDAARMLVLDPFSDTLTHATIRDLPGYLEAGDLLVFNDSRVLPARLIGRRRDGGEDDGLLLRPAGDGRDRGTAVTTPESGLCRAPTGI